MIAAQITNLTKKYKNGRGIEDLSLSIEEGRVTGLLGPNGSGKTTTMKLMCGLITPDSGEMRIFDRDPVESIEQVMENVGCLIESPAFHPYLTAVQNLEIIRRLYPDCPKARVLHVLEQVGLLQYKDDKTGRFSLGMKQRLGLAMTMLSEPQMLILDEPMSGLDIEGMADIRQIIIREAKNGKTILISSHLSSEIQEICTDIAVIREGRLIATAKVPEILANFGSVENYYLNLIKHECGETA